VGFLLLLLWASSPATVVREDGNTWAIIVTALRLDKAKPEAIVPI
jgi:hypothetical protein